MTTSDGPRLNRVSTASWAFVRRLAWLSSAPLGCPVVPEVYRMSAVSSSARPARSGAGGWACSSAARSAAPAGRKSAPAAAAPAAGSPGESAAANSRAAPESLR